MNETLITLASKLILASTSGDQMNVDTISNELSAALTSQKDKGEQNSPFDFYLGNVGFLKFTNQEILKLPKTFRKEFRIQGCTAHIRKRKSGKHTFNYEIRYRRNGYYVEVSANNIEEAKRKFIEKLNAADKLGLSTVISVPTTFHEFATYYFETFWKRTVTELTYTNEMYRYKNHIQPIFGSIELKKIMPAHCQKLLDDKGISKTSDEIYSALSKIFKSAIKHGIITHNPLDLVVHTKHEREHGKALTKDEEKLLLDDVKNSRYQVLFAIALYTGLRPNEYKTATVDGSFITAVNSKQKNGKIAYKKIPITPMLKPYLNGVTELKFPRIEYMRDKMKDILPNHKLYDLRTTFYTRCKECGIADVAIKKFVGHSLGGMADTYTDLSDEFLIREGNKLNY